MVPAVGERLKGGILNLALAHGEYYGQNLATYGASTMNDLPKAPQVKTSRKRRVLILSITLNILLAYLISLVVLNSRGFVRTYSYWSMAVDVVNTGDENPPVQIQFNNSNAGSAVGYLRHDHDDKYTYVIELTNSKVVSRFDPLQFKWRETPMWNESDIRTELNSILNGSDIVVGAIRY